MLFMRVEEIRNPTMELALDSIGRQFGEESRMPDCIKSSRYFQRDGPDLMSDIEHLRHCFESRLRTHPSTWVNSLLLLLCMQHKAAGRSETELRSEIRPLEKNNNLMLTAMIDSIT